MIQRDMRRRTTPGPAAGQKKGKEPWSTSGAETCPGCNASVPVFLGLFAIHDGADGKPCPGIGQVE